MPTLRCRQPVRLSGPRGAVGAFTIIELLLALALVIALSSIVLPFAAARVREATRAEIPDQIEAAIWSARALAQRQGLPVRVLVEQGDHENRIVATVVRPVRQDLHSMVPPREQAAALPLANLGQTRIERADPPSAIATGPNDAASTASLLLALAMPTEVCISRAQLLVKISGQPDQELRIDPASFAVTLAPHLPAGARPGDEAPPHGSRVPP